MDYFLLSTPECQVRGCLLPKASYLRGGGRECEGSYIRAFRLGVSGEARRQSLGQTSLPWCVLSIEPHFLSNHSLLAKRLREDDARESVIV